MTNLEDLKDDNTKLMISNFIKIQDWIFKTFSSEEIKELVINHCSGQFVSNGYTFTWSISEPFGFYFKVGGLSMVGDVHSPYDINRFNIRYNNWLYHMGFNADYGCITDSWPELKSKIYDVYTKIKARKNFKP